MSTPRQSRGAKIGGQMTPRKFICGQTWYFDPPDF